MRRLLLPGNLQTQARVGLNLCWELSLSSLSCFFHLAQEGSPWNRPSLYCSILPLRTWSLPCLLGQVRLAVPGVPPQFMNPRSEESGAFVLSSTSSGSIISAFRNALRFNSDTWVCFHLSSEIDLVPACLKLKY